MGGWLAYECELMAPVYEALRKKVISSGYIQADESPIKVLEKSKKGKKPSKKGKGTAHRGYQWVYHSPVERLVLFEYCPGRGGLNPKDFLNGFQGHLQADGYTAYDWFDKQPGVDLLHCMAHARRYFEQALDNDRPRAEHALSEMGKLYDIEKQARDKAMSFEERLDLRQKKKAMDILSELGEWLKVQAGQVLPRSPIGKAISYALARWDKLSAYATNGMLEIDNNFVENAIRPLALGRKNYLFAGSHEAAQRIAMFYSFFGTCAKNNVNPYKWLKRVLEIISDHPINKIEELLPTNSTFFGAGQN